MEVLVKYLIEYYENVNKFVKDKSITVSSNKILRDTFFYVKNSFYLSYYYKKYTGNGSEGSFYVVYYKFDIVYVLYLLNVGGKLNVLGSSYLFVNGYGGLENGYFF